MTPLHFAFLITLALSVIFLTKWLRTDTQAKYWENQADDARKQLSDNLNRQSKEHMDRMYQMVHGQEEKATFRELRAENQRLKAQLPVPLLPTAAIPLGTYQVVGVVSQDGGKPRINLDMLTTSSRYGIDPPPPMKVWGELLSKKAEVYVVVKTEDGCL